MSVSRNIEDTRVARVNDDVVNEKMRAIEIVKQSPRLSAIRRSVNLAVERPEVEMLWVIRINDERAHVSARWACRAPVHSVLRIGLRAIPTSFDGLHAGAALSE